MRGCLIGCGFVSRYHLEAWSRQSLGRLVAVCDLDPSKAEAAGRQADCAWYVDVEVMLDRERPEFVEIATRPESHLPLVRLAAGRGVHVLCQKPAAPSLDELREMIRVCDQSNTRLMIHENFRWRAWNLRLKEELEAGRVGSPFRLTVAMQDTRCLRADGLGDQAYFREMPRLILYEIGPHAIDFARFLFGEPERVFAVSRRIGRQLGEDFAHVFLQFPGGRSAQIDLSWVTAQREATHPEQGLHDTSLEGDLGTIRTRSDGQLQWYPAVGPSEILHVVVDPDPLVASYAAVQTHFLERLKSGERFLTDGEDTLNTMSVVFAAYESARTGCAIVL